MKRTTIWTGIALGAWLISIPAGFTWAQTGSGNAQTGGTSTTQSSGPTSNTTGVGGGVGGAYGGASGNTYGNIISGNTNTGSTNLNNGGATDRFRGQGIDRAGDAPLQGGNQFDRYNGGNTNTARDRYRSRQEQLNDDDSFQSDPYQSSRNSGERYDRRRDAIERRRYQEQQLIDSANRPTTSRPNFTGGYDDRYYSREDDLYGSQYNDNNFRNDYNLDRNRYFNDRYNNDGVNRGTTNVFIDDGYGYDRGVVDGAYIDDNGNYIGRGVATQYAPQRTRTRVTVREVERARKPPVTRLNTNDSSLRDRGAGNFDQLPNNSARKQSMDRAANYVDANLGREADERIDEEFPRGTGTEAGRRVDARLDPRAR